VIFAVTVDLLFTVTQIQVVVRSVI